MEADGGLAGSGPALHDEAGFERSPDDRVLFGLDRGDDVAHRARAGPAELGEQRVRHSARAHERVGVVEVLLEDVAQLPSREHEAAPPLEPEGVGERRSVERRCHSCAPIDHDGRARVVFDVATTDVPGVAQLLVDAPEAEDCSVVVE